MQDIRDFYAGLLARLGKLPGFRRLGPLAREISLILLIKIVLLYGLWWAFFSQPLDEHLTYEAVGNAWFDNVRPGDDKPAR